MFCPNCKAEVSDDSKFCGHCGYDFARANINPEERFDQGLLHDLDTTPETKIGLKNLDIGALFDNRYEILSEGKKGGVGVVFKVKDTVLSKVKALKVIDPLFSVNKQRLSEFEKEIAVSQDLIHPNIVRVYDIGGNEAIQYFTMQWVEGRSLREILTDREEKARPFKLDEAYELISQAADALNYAHRYTIHGNIKPENFLITDLKGEIQVKLTDFGIRKASPSNEFFEGPERTENLSYVAPEQSVDGVHVDKRADIYALGVLLFELLTLEHRIGSETPSQINRSLPWEIDPIIEKATRKEPGERYGGIGEFVEALFQVVQIAKEKSEEEKRRVEEKKKLKEEEKQRALKLINEGQACENAGRYQEALNCYTEAETISSDVEVIKFITVVKRKIEEEEERELIKQEMIKRKQEEEERKKRSVAIKRKWTAFIVIAGVSCVIAYFLMGKSSDQKRLFSEVNRYYRLVQSKDVDRAWSMYASKKKPHVNVGLIKDIAKDTEYYRIDKLELVELGDTRAKVHAFLYHKKNRKPEEYWDITFEFVKENNHWKIWSTPGKRIR